jgi:hypothetical protein
MKPLTIALLGIGSYLVWKAVSKPVAPALADVQLKRPVGANLASRVGHVTDTRGLGDFTPVLGPDGSVRTTLPRTNNPMDSGTTMAWWQKPERDQLNFSSPADPYTLPPVDEQGNPVNIGIKSPFRTDTPGEVMVESYGMVDHLAQPINAKEPGSATYGDPGVTDFGAEEDDGAYDDAPGALIGLRSN